MFNVTIPACCLRRWACACWQSLTMAARACMMVVIYARAHQPSTLRTLHTSCTHNPWSPAYTMLCSTRPECFLVHATQTLPCTRYIAMLSSWANPCVPPLHSRSVGSPLHSRSTRSPTSLADLGHTGKRLEAEADASGSDSDSDSSSSGSDSSSDSDEE